MKPELQKLYIAFDTLKSQLKKASSKIERKAIEERIEQCLTQIIFFESF